MNQVTTTQNAPRPAVRAGGPVAALVPQSLEEAFRVANAIAQSGLAPQGLKTPEQILVAIMAGAELGLAPFQSLQSIAVVNGRPSLWGDGLMAIARSQGIRAREWIEGAGDEAAAHCEVTRPDTGEVIVRAFTVPQAKKAGLWGKQGPWQQYPERMLQMRARAWALRDGCADFLRGFQVREEVEDFAHGAPREAAPRTSLRARLAAPAETGFSHEHVEREIGGEFVEVDPDPAPPDEDAPSSDPIIESEARDPQSAEPSDEGQVSSPSDLPLDTLKKYANALFRVTSEKSLNDLIKVFWTENGGMPAQGTDAYEEVRAVNAVHKRRVMGEIDADRARAEITELVGS